MRHALAAAFLAAALGGQIAHAATTAYTYDALGRLKAAGYSGASSSRLNYDAAGNRQLNRPAPFIGHVDSNGFDAEYYLLTYPDIAAAGVDPWQHFLQYGWQEGRNPNAYFDTNGYKAAYADVTGNPLLHYNQFGWHEGRDPSGAFNTSQYLANYPDITNAGINPLIHFLQYGLDEGRSAFGSGGFDPPH